MKILGNKIKNARLTAGLSQKELAAGICNQSTISNLEKGISIPSLLTLMIISERLNIDFDEIYQYTTKKKDSYADIFQQVRVLCAQIKHKDAYNLIKEKIDFNRLETPYELKQYYYYLGITSLIGNKNSSDGIYYFNLALTTESGKNVEFLDILATSGMATVYDIRNEDNKALTYFEKVMNQLDQLTCSTSKIEDGIEVAKIYYNMAKFYSKIKDYKLAVHLSTLGINLIQEQHISYYLDFLLYEKGFNLMKLGQVEEAEKYYFYAAAMANLNDNQHAVEGIKRNMKDYNLKGYNYWE
nr:helix-turn-helix transcriptional regulator [Carnobacterium maltaromaticum]